MVTADRYHSPSCPADGDPCLEPLGFGGRAAVPNPVKDPSSDAGCLGCQA